MKKPWLKFEVKYQLCLWKTYFETGYALTNYLKYPLLLIGFLEKINVSAVVWYSLLYAVLCFAIGYYWYRTDFARAAAEVGNRYNKLAIELRNKVIRKHRKL